MTMVADNLRAHMHARIHATKRADFCIQKEGTARRLFVFKRQRLQACAAGEPGARTALKMATTWACRIMHTLLPHLCTSGGEEAHQNGGGACASTCTSDGRHACQSRQLRACCQTLVVVKVLRSASLRRQRKRRVPRGRTGADRTRARTQAVRQHTRVRVRLLLPSAMWCGCGSPSSAGGGSLTDLWQTVSDWWQVSC